MKKIRCIIPLILSIIMILSVPLAASAEAGSDDVTPLTAKQIVRQMKKSVPVGKVHKMKSSELITGRINQYTSKYSFYDKKLKKVYCTVEVFNNKDDAIRSAGYIDCLSQFYGTFGWTEDIPLMAFQYKNVVIRVGSKMSYKKAKKYYNAMKKIVKKSLPKE